MPVSELISISLCRQLVQPPKEKDLFFGCEARLLQSSRLNSRLKACHIQSQWLVVKPSRQLYRLDRQNLEVQIG